MTIAFIAMGSNLGNRNYYIKKALAYLQNSVSVLIQTTSTLIETSPCGGPPQGKYLNGVVKILTSLSPQDLLKLLQHIELKLGRKRGVVNGPRTIDLDILLYGNENINEPNLQIPHPRMCQREFVIKPLLEIEPKLKLKLSDLNSRILSI